MEKRFSVPISFSISLLGNPESIVGQVKEDQKKEGGASLSKIR